MRFKRLLALLLAAALALSLLAGCGNGESAASALLKLLDGKYPNISIEIDPELEADLRQAISTAEAQNAGDDDAVIRAALETALGSNITFRYLGDGQKGDTAFDLIFYAGSDPDKAAQAAYNQWNPILSNVPADGQYGTALAMVETNSGVWMLVKATVEKAGSRDDGPDPVTIQGLSATLSNTTYYQGSIFRKSDLTVTATYSDGKQETIDTSRYTATINGTDAEGQRFITIGERTITVSFGDQTATVTIEVTANPAEYYEATDGNYIVTGTDGLQNLYDNLEETGGSFASAKITLNSSVTLGDAWSEYITFSGTLNGNGKTITLTENRTQGLFNTNNGIVQDVDIQVTGTIDGDNVGAVAGKNYGTIQNCHVAGTDASMIKGSSGYGAGGIAGYNYKIIQGCSASVWVQDGDYAGGVVGWNDGGGNVTACCSTSIVYNPYFYTGGVVGYNDGGTVNACYHAVGEVSSFTAGGVVSYNAGSVNDCYWSGSPVRGIDTGTGWDSAEYGPNGNNMVGSNSTPDWQTAMDTMNTALIGESWHYELGNSSTFPLVIKPGKGT